MHRSYFIEPDDRSTMDLVAGARTRTFWGQHLLLSLVEIDANSEVPKHVHPHEPAGVLIEGEMEMGIGDEVKQLKPGDRYIVPANVEHYAIYGDLPAKAPDIFSPVREEFQY